MPKIDVLSQIATLTISICDGGTLHVPFHSDIQRWLWILKKYRLRRLRPPQGLTFFSILIVFYLHRWFFRPKCLLCAASLKEENGVLGIPCVPYGPCFSRLEEIIGLGIPLRSLWPKLHCRRVAGVSPLLSISWWVLSSAFPKRHCYSIVAAYKECPIYPLHSRPDAVALYSGCTPGKRLAWFLPDDRPTASLVGPRGGWRHSRMKLYFRAYGLYAAVPG
ncbi:uncharacterized protein TNCV_3198031 [Trichonephila clavipes]|nr:uncharacterized protein TNCV_3198031 [Trichonephila clavipes]